MTQLSIYLSFVWFIKWLNQCLKRLMFGFIIVHSFLTYGVFIGTVIMTYHTQMNSGQLEFNQTNSFSRWELTKIKASGAGAMATWFSEQWIIFQIQGVHPCRVHKIKGVRFAVGPQFNSQTSRTRMPIRISQWYLTKPSWGVIDGVKIAAAKRAPFFGNVAGWLSQHPHH